MSAETKGERETTLMPGNVLRYSPRVSHAREGMAIVEDSGRAFDTYWSAGGRAQLSPEDLKTAEVIFNIGDYDQLDPYVGSSRPRWEQHHPDDRQRVTSQRGLQEVLYVRKGATPDRGTQIDNAREAIREAEENARSAESRLKWARDDLRALEEVS